MTVRHINNRIVIERGLQTELVLSAEEARELLLSLQETVAKWEPCDKCGKTRPVAFSNLVRAFCSRECADAYLAEDGF